MDAPTPHELALMRSLQALDHTIRHLCKERDALAAQLPKRPMPRMGKQLDGVEIRRKR